MKKQKPNKPLPGTKPPAWPVHPMLAVIDAIESVVRKSARRIDLAITIDGDDYKVVVYRQLDNIVRCDLKRTTN